MEGILLPTKSRTRLDGYYVNTACTYDVSKRAYLLTQNNPYDWKGQQDKIFDVAVWFYHYLIPPVWYYDLYIILHIYVMYLYYRKLVYKKIITLYRYLVILSSNHFNKAFCKDAHSIIYRLTLILLFYIMVNILHVMDFLEFCWTNNRQH